MSNIIRISGHIDALSPIHHGGDEKTGSVPVLRQIVHWDAEGKRHVQLPFISGNAIRGVMRRMVFHDMMGRLGYQNESTKLHHALFTGGILESTSETTGKIDLATRRWLRDAFPPLGLIGTAIGNQILTGCLKVDHAFPVCKEYHACLADGYRADDRAAHSVRTFTDISFGTRKDDLRAERGENDQAMQMLIEFECFIPGTRFVHGFTLEYASPLEVSCFAHMLDLWRAQPWIAGKSASGYGRVAFEYESDGEELSGQRYREYLESGRDKLNGALAELAGRL